MKLTRSTGKTSSTKSPASSGPAASEAGRERSGDVNLVPQLVRDTIAVRRIRKIMTWIAVLCIAGLAAVWLLQFTPITQAQERLDAAQQQSVQLGAKVKALAPIGQMYTLLTDQEEFITGALASQVRVAEIQEALQTDAGPRIQFTNVALTNTGIPQPGATADSAVTCPDADPFTVDLVVGCVSFTATGDSREQVAAFLNQAMADPMFVNPYVTTTTVGESAGGGQQVTFSGSAGLSLDSLATVMTQDQIDQLKADIEAAAQAAATPSPSPSPEAGAAS